ncbi:hypothetical protein ABPG77_004354 [Micractinium sp. CCAP 211/92]
MDMATADRALGGSPCAEAEPAGGASAAAAAAGDSNQWQDAERQVVLGIEYMGDSATRVLLYQFRFALVLALGILVWETVVKFSQSNRELIQFDTLVTVNTVIAAVCLAVALGVAALLLYRLWCTVPGRVWAALRARTVLLFGAELAVQLINLVFFLAPNALVLAQPCSWFLAPIHAFGIVRWTCWNTLFCLFVVQAHSPLPARYTGKLLLRTALSGARRPVLAAQQLLARTGSAALRGVDAGWTAAQHLIRLSPLGSARWRQRRGAGLGAKGLGRQASAPPAPAAAGSSSAWPGAVPPPMAGEAGVGAGVASPLPPTVGAATEGAPGQDIEAVVAASPFALAQAAASQAAVPAVAGGAREGGAGEPFEADCIRPSASAPAGRIQLSAAPFGVAPAAAAAPAAVPAAGAQENRSPTLGSGPLTLAPSAPLEATGPQPAAGQPEAAAEPPPGGSLWSASSAATHADIPVAGEEERLVMELPFQAHYGKGLLLWLPCQIVLVCFSLYIWGVFGSHGPPCDSISDVRCFPQAVNGTADCRQWRYNCSKYTDNAALVFSCLASALCMLTLVVYFWLILYAQRQLARRPYVLFRNNNVLLRTQFQTRLLAAGFFLLSNTLFWYISGVHSHNCTSYMETWLGLTPMQIVMTSLVVLNTICVLPADPGFANHDLHAWMQDFAWLEKDLPRKLMRRPLPAGEPMFCVETALKLLCWSWVVYYDHDASDGATTEGTELKANDSAQEEPAAAEAGGTLELQSNGSAAAGAAEAPGLEQPLPAPPDAQARQLAQQQPSLQRGEGQPAAGEGPPEDVTLATAMALYGLSHHATLYGPQHDAKCLVGWSPAEAVIVICFRGTCSLTNVLNNMKVWRAPHPPLRGSYWTCSRPMVHRGFLASYEANGLNQQVMDKLRSILAAHPQPWRLLFTGHSLGGALASLAAYDTTRLLRGGELPRGCRSSEVAVYTFGCPREGNHAFARDYGSAVPHSFDVIHADDTVTRNGKFLVLYKRSAHRVVLSPTGDLIIRPTLIERAARESFTTSFQQHLLSAYARSFAAIIRGQFDRDKEHNGGRRGCQALLQCEYVQQVLRITANMRSESMAGMARGRRLLRAPTMPPGPDRNPASGEPLTQSQQRRAAAAAAAAVPWARRPVGKASWQVQRSTGSLSWPPPGSRQASSFHIDRLASV